MIVFALHHLYLYNLGYSTYLSVLLLCCIKECSIKKRETENDLNKELELKEQKGEEDFSSDQSSVTAPSAAPQPACAAGLKDASAISTTAARGPAVMLREASLRSSCRC